MLQPIPGLSHLKYLVPELIPAPHPQKEPVPKEVSGLVRVALDSAFGLRPLTQLHPRRFDTPVRAHIIARQKAGHVGVAKLISCHIQMNGAVAEAFGSVRFGESTTAYAARLSESDGIWRMLNFRVLS
ncbi:hypothetical protein CFAEC_03285 [Corynebacterium faecale]|uniref:Rv3235 family protein n=1 Tax=Corynebacterium faecale TaxID=1758466 RepID=UPI0025B3F4D3|nr:Rv3235 family protein [Corynebacterium faecale]WJY91511.1 hypothetical protein CFAEC_03285 [Corynebacterium faecale]